MDCSRNNSLSEVDLPKWRWNTFLNHSINLISSFSPSPLPIPKHFLEKEIKFGVKDKSCIAKTVTWGCQIKKIRKIRAACVDAGSTASVLNLVFQPFEYYDLPFFGADFVTLGSGHLLALDLQPVLKNDRLHTESVWDKLIPLHDKWQSLLPSGGPIPVEAESFFSPGFLWAKIPLGPDGEELIDNIIFPAFKDYLSLYCEIMINAKSVKEDRSILLLKGQREYLQYRSEKDPARAMLTRFYGREWTNDYIHNILF